MFLNNHAVQYCSTTYMRATKLRSVFFLSFFCQDLIKDNKLGHQGPQKNIDPSEEAKKEKHLCLADKMHLFGWGLHKWIHSI